MMFTQDVEDNQSPLPRQGMHYTRTKIFCGDVAKVGKHLPRETP